MLDKRVVALIPARGGSKRLKNKNIRKFCGKPLITWTIALALSVKEIDTVLVSTDDPRIATISRRHGAEIINRPPQLATDEAMTIDVIHHAVTYMEQMGRSHELMLYLEPTCPLRSESDLLHALSLLVSAEKFDSVASFSSAELHPHRAWTLDGNKPEPFIRGAIPWLPSQKLPAAYQLNGAVYAFWIDRMDEQTVSPLYGKIGSFLIPKQRALDIDDEIDFQFAEFLMKRKWLYARDS